MMKVAMVDPKQDNEILTISSKDDIIFALSDYKANIRIQQCDKTFVYYFTY